MISTLVLFLPFDWTRKIIAKMSTKSITTSNRSLMDAKKSSTAAAPIDKSRNYLVIALIHVYLIIQLLVPLRQFLYSGRSDWTEQGQLFAWRMMLRDKKVLFEMYVSDPQSGEYHWINPYRYLSDIQSQAMVADPSMIITFAHHLAELEKAKTGVHPSVKAHVLASLNGRPFQNLIDPDVDLAAQPINRLPASWIMPLAQ